MLGKAEPAKKVLKRLQGDLFMKHEAVLHGGQQAVLHMEEGFHVKGRSLTQHFPVFLYVGTEPLQGPCQIRNG